MNYESREKLTRDWPLAFSHLWPSVVGLRCPACTEGKLFKSFFMLRETCERCGVRFERDPGSYIVSMVLSYFIVAIIMVLTGLFLVLRYGFFGGLTWLLVGLGCALIFLLHRPVKGLYMWLLWVFGFVYRDKERATRCDRVAG